MSDISSWTRKYWPELAWGAWASANLLVTVLLAAYETVPFHFIWISLTLLYGWRVWTLRLTLIMLGGVCLATGLSLGWVVTHSTHGPDELTEVPLMAAVFLGMVWHAERRQAALHDAERAAVREHDFLRSASHQLKTPIAVARALAGLIRDGHVLTSRRQDLADLVEELDRLNHTAEDLLLLAAARQPGGLLLGPVDLEDTLVRAAARWSRTADRRWRIEPCDGVLTSADRDRLDSAIDAVIDNAVRATRPDDTIAIAGRAEGGAAVIEIRDSGPGIAEESLPHVIERFWSGPGGPDGRRGTGLGLAIVDAIVTAHGGNVRVLSTLGTGTTVQLWLPGLEVPAVVDELPPALAGAGAAA
jgi:signal transduction histidine kinase